MDGVLSLSLAHSHASSLDKQFPTVKIKASELFVPELVKIVFRPSQKPQKQKKNLSRKNCHSTQTVIASSDPHS